MGEGEEHQAGTRRLDLTLTLLCDSRPTPFHPRAHDLSSIQ